MDSFFLVSVNFALVAKDVTATLAQKGMGKPLIATTPTDAMEALQNLPEGQMLKLAIIQMPPDLFVASPLHAALKSVGAPVILLDDSSAPDTTDQCYPVLTLPFFTEDLERALAKLLNPYRSGLSGGMV